MRCEQEIAVGAYLLDALEPDEQLRMREHVEMCPVCAESVNELEATSRLLAGIEVTRLTLEQGTPQSSRPSEFAYQRLRSAIAEPPPAAATSSTTPTAASPVRLLPAAAPRRRPWRALAVAAAAVVVIGGAGGGVVALSGSGPVPVTLTATQAGVSAHAKITPSGSGSLITLTLDGVPVGQRCRLVAVGRDGDRDSTHMWAITRPGSLHWTDTVAVSPHEIDHLEVVTADGHTLLRLSA